MTTNKVRRLYHQKYREDWERFPSFAPWLCRGDDGYSAHCKICDANVLARLASIKQHNNAVKHQKAMKSYQPGVKGVNSKMERMAKYDSVKKVGQKTVVAKPKPVKSKRIKMDKINMPPTPPPAEEMEPDTCSNDSMLEDLLGNDDSNVEPEYLQTMGDHEIKTEMLQEHVEFNDDNFNDDNIISEFDLFGKSLSLQLNHMDLKDALHCQERLQVVLTEFRLKILKRKAKRSY